MKRRILSNRELNERVRSNQYISCDEDLSYDIEGFLTSWIKQAKEDYEGAPTRFVSYCKKILLDEPYYHSGVPKLYYYEMQDNFDDYSNMIESIARKYT